MVANSRRIATQLCSSLTLYRARQFWFSVSAFVGFISRRMQLFSLEPDTADRVSNYLVNREQFSI